MNETQDKTLFTSHMTRGETLAVLLWLPVHALLLPWLLLTFFSDRFSEADLNLILYGLGLVYMLLTAGRFLRRDFDPLCDRPVWTLFQVLISYGLVLACNMLLSALLRLVMPLDNPNNEAVMGLAHRDLGKVTAMAVFLAPLLEELLFRGGVFGSIRRWNRNVAYGVSMLLFALYHVWAYAQNDPMSWLYLLQYMPVGFLLCRCYERTNSIWGSILLHMLNNAVSMRVLWALL
ncbi:MAG: CPBP family intramembrane metalloprotease [Oscillospiraceae bacterium]|nr:CPBP family intramembrane metalloprotease [Oscillospiraceae bacterium]